MAVAIAAPIIPKMGMNIKFIIIFDITDIKVILKITFTLPILDNVVPTEEKVPVKMNPNNNINNGIYASEKSLENINRIRNCPVIAMNTAENNVMRKLFLIVEKTYLLTSLISPLACLLAMVGLVIC